MYGSDALAGAVNFILRNDFDGFETSLQYEVTERGDGDTYNFDAQEVDPSSVTFGPEQVVSLILMAILKT